MHSKQKVATGSHDRPPRAHRPCYRYSIYTCFIGRPNVVTKGRFTRARKHLMNYHIKNIERKWIESHHFTFFKIFESVYVLLNVPSWKIILSFHSSTFSVFESRFKHFKNIERFVSEWTGPDERYENRAKNIKWKSAKMQKRSEADALCTKRCQTNVNVFLRRITERPSGGLFWPQGC